MKVAFREDLDGADGDAATGGDGTAIADLTSAMDSAALAVVEEVGGLPKGASGVDAGQAGCDEAMPASGPTGDCSSALVDVASRPPCEAATDGSPGVSPLPSAASSVSVPAPEGPLKMPVPATTRRQAAPPTTAPPTSGTQPGHSAAPSSARPPAIDTTGTGPAWLAARCGQLITTLPKTFGAASFLAAARGAVDAAMTAAAAHTVLDQLVASGLLLRRSGGRYEAVDMTPTPPMPHAPHSTPASVAGSQAGLPPLPGAGHGGGGAIEVRPAAHASAATAAPSRGKAPPALDEVPIARAMYARAMVVAWDAVEATAKPARMAATELSRLVPTTLPIAKALLKRWAAKSWASLVSGKGYVLSVPTTAGHVAALREAHAIVHAHTTGTAAYPGGLAVGSKRGRDEDGVTASAATATASKLARLSAVPEGPAAPAAWQRTIAAGGFAAGNRSTARFGVTAKRGAPPAGVREGEGEGLWSFEG